MGTEAEERYRDRIKAAEEFILYHPDGWPSADQDQRTRPTWPQEYAQREFWRGFYERLDREVGTASDPTENWGAKIRASGHWPDELDS